jgi:hypothetical protein
MLWTYHRQGLRTSYEVNQSADGACFELKRRHDDGREECETFNTLTDLDRRIADLRDELVGAGWMLAGAAAPARSRGTL